MTNNWKPIYTKTETIQKLLHDISILEKISREYFSKHKNKQLDNQLILLEAQGSADIEWYSVKNIMIQNDKLSVHGISSQNTSFVAINNLFKAYKKKFQDTFSNDFLISLQKQVTNKTWKSPQEKDEIQFGNIRNKDVFVVEQIKYRMIESFIPPHFTDVKNLLDKLTQYVNESLENGTENPYILAIIVKVFFVIIHPFMDWNGRISRLLYLYILKQLWCIKSVSQLPISHTINTNRNKYYAQLEYNAKNIMKHARVTRDINGWWIAIYDDVSIYKTVDYTNIIEYFLTITKETYLNAIYMHSHMKIEFDVLNDIKKAVTLSDKQKKIITNILESQLHDFSWWKNIQKKIGKCFNENESNTIKQIIQSHSEKTNCITNIAQLSELDGINKEDIIQLFQNT